MERSAGYSNMVQMQYKDSILTAICSGLERQEEWETWPQTLAQCYKDSETPCAPNLVNRGLGEIQPRFNTVGDLVLISRGSLPQKML